MPTRGALGDVGERAASPTKASAGSSRAGTPAISSPSGRPVGQVLRGVDAEVDLAVEQRALDLAHEARLVAAALAPVARGLDRDDLGVAERVGDELRLGERQRAAASAERALALLALAAVVVEPRHLGVLGLEIGAVSTSRPNSSRSAWTRA